ncbi:hypothetical protein CFOL_v3_06644 [Cephalotus follicularis]|uniref:UBN2 domain-containing protein n=1 Tax=Cephalotus follicularis TaxID=3775 RepID=A0A1Q3B5R1_CEPFO|nr:hypothetical protein CFOL_v3_06644 [Cephalotus follicularis]
MFVFFFLVIVVIPNYVTESSHIPMLSGDNFSEWKEKILFTFGGMDVDLTLRVDEPPIPTELNRWERSNRLSLMLVLSHVNKRIRGSDPNCDKAANYMKAMEEQSVRSDKALGSTLMKKFSGMRFDNSKSVREHIMEMRDIAAQLKFLEV